MLILPEKHPGCRCHGQGIEPLLIISEAKSSDVRDHVYRPRIWIGFLTVSKVIFNSCHFFNVALRKRNVAGKIRSLDELTNALRPDRFSKVIPDRTKIVGWKVPVFHGCNV